MFKRIKGLFRRKQITEKSAKESDSIAKVEDKESLAIQVGYYINIKKYSCFIVWAYD